MHQRLLKVFLGVCLIDNERVKQLTNADERYQQDASKGGNKLGFQGFPKNNDRWHGAARHAFGYKRLNNRDNACGVRVKRNACHYRSRHGQPLLFAPALG